MRKQLCGRLWSVRNFEFLLRRLSKCWCSAQTVFSLSRNVSSLTVPGLRHSSSNMAKMPFWFWTYQQRKDNTFFIKPPIIKCLIQKVIFNINLCSCCLCSLIKNSTKAVRPECGFMQKLVCVVSALGDWLTFSMRSQIIALLKYSMLVHSMPCNKRNEGQVDNGFSISSSALIRQFYISRSPTEFSAWWKRTWTFSFSNTAPDWLKNRRKNSRLINDALRKVSFKCCTCHCWKLEMIWMGLTTLDVSQDVMFLPV